MKKLNSVFQKLRFVFILSVIRSAFIFIAAFAALMMILTSNAMAMSQILYLGFVVGIQVIYISMYLIWVSVLKAAKTIGDGNSLHSSGIRKIRTKMYMLFLLNVLFIVFTYLRELYGVDFSSFHFEPFVSALIGNSGRILSMQLIDFIAPVNLGIFYLATAALFSNADSREPVN